MAARNTAKKMSPEEKAFREDYFELQFTGETDKAVRVSVEWEDFIVNLGIGSPGAWFPKSWLNKDGDMPGWAILKKVEELAVIPSICDTLDELSLVAGHNPDAIYYPVSIGGCDEYDSAWLDDDDGK